MTRSSKSKKKRFLVSLKEFAYLPIDLREYLRSRVSEAKRVKALAQVILDQRSDVEQFFLEALEQIKEEIRKKIAQERKSRRLGQPTAT